MIGRVAVLGSAIAVAWLAGTSVAAAPPVPSCTISATSVTFGNYNVFTTSTLDSTGTVTYDCNSQVPSISVALSRGASSTFTPRTLKKGTESLSYNLYLDASRTQVWGDGTAGTSVLSVINPANTNPGNSSRSVNVTVYGRIPALQDVSAGAYTDTVVVTVNF